MVRYTFSKQGVISLNRKQPVTSFGWAIKQRLAELQMDQKTFCECYGIPPSRLSNLINGTRKAARYRKQVAELLDIPEYFQ
jgi:antitoxin HigA-1